MSSLRTSRSPGPAPLNSRYTYHHIFSDICKTRFNHFATGLLWKASLIISLVAVLLSKWSMNKWQKLIVWPLKALSLYAAVLVLIITRKNYLHVDFLGYTSWITAIYGQLLSLKWVTYQIIFSLSAFLISLTLKSSFFDEIENITLHTLFYNVSIFVVVPTVYSIQHLLLDLDRLTFNYGTQHQHPQKYISSKLYDSFLKCSILTLIIFIGCPILFKFSLGYFFSSAFAHLKISLLSYTILQLWDLTNIGFDAFLSIGCLHRGKPISSLSSTPIETLVTGLRSEKLFVKLTAFQELAYRATSPDIQLRIPIYHTSYRNGSIWPSILRECLIVVQATNNDVSDFLITLNKEISPQQTKRFLPVKPSADHLFGNNHVIRSQNDDSDSRLPGAPPSENRFEDAHSPPSHRIVLQENNIFRNKDSKQKLESLRFTESYKQSIFTSQPTILSLLNELWQWILKKVTDYFFTIDSNDKSKRKLSLLELYHISKIRESEKLCPVPVCYAECVISMMGLLVNSLDEDPKGSVVSSVGEVLKILERSIGSLGSFTEWELDENHNSESNDIISILYDLSINAFLEIVLKYNDSLNDVYLDEDVVKLTQWLLKLSQEI